VRISPVSPLRREPTISEGWWHLPPMSCRSEQTRERDRNNNEATIRFVPASEANCQYESVHRLPLREFRTHPFEMD
jgi:hypothetical protein